MLSRFEFTDPAGDTCKAVGQIVIELHSADDPSHLSEPLDSWPIDLADLGANFLPHLMALTLACSFTLFVLRQTGWSIAGMVVFLSQMMILAPYFDGLNLNVDAVESKVKFRVLQFNVSSRNTDFNAFLNWLQPRVNAYDVIILMENTPHWAPSVL